MPVLLRDATACRNELGRILYANPDEWSVQMDIVSTNTLSNFFTSHTEYHISLTAVPNSLAGNLRCFDMWTRFRDVKRLWEQLADLHKKLHLHGSFPQFAEAVIFGNQSAQIVGGRTSSITTFLNYVLAHPVLRQSKVLQDYFEKAVEIENPSKHKDPLEPVHSNGGESFGTNVVHVSQYKDQDSNLFFISEHDNSLSPSSPGQLYFKTCPMPSTAMRENSMFNAQENNAANPMSSGMMNQTSSSQSPYVFSPYCCVTLSQQAHSNQFSRGNNGPLHDYS
ncbi:unnamed protein product [Cercopithifilaria johnstoni]|uniref:PX domain-containing protein n=1 Tax=Cercopithifilaria johnstoni TaxID=2874296 RepID=A0A8J2Q748_9BILA|nr:unnamed protein product [Cercopithifilaria johnstoni]